MATVISDGATACSCRTLILTVFLGLTCVANGKDNHLLRVSNLDIDQLMRLQPEPATQLCKSELLLLVMRMPVWVCPYPFGVKRNPQYADNAMRIRGPNS